MPSLGFVFPAAQLTGGCWLSAPAGARLWVAVATSGRCLAEPRPPHRSLGLPAAADKRLLPAGSCRPRTNRLASRERRAEATSPFQTPHNGGTQDTGTKGDLGGQRGLAHAPADPCSSAGPTIPRPHDTQAPRVLVVTPMMDLAAQKGLSLRPLLYPKSSGPSWLTPCTGWKTKDGRGGGEREVQHGRASSSCVRSTAPHGPSSCCPMERGELCCGPSKPLVQHLPWALRGRGRRVSWFQLCRGGRSSRQNPARRAQRESDKGPGGQEAAGRRSRRRCSCLRTLPCAALCAPTLDPSSPVCDSHNEVSFLHCRQGGVRATPAPDF